MVVITDITVSAEQFAIGRIFEEFPDIEIQLERVVPVRSAIIPFIWFEGADRNDIGRVLRADPLTEDVEFLTETDDRYLFKLTWNEDVDHLVQPTIRNDAEVLRGSGTTDRWDFRLQFRDREDLVDFRQAAIDGDVEIELRRLYDPRPPDETGILTAEQRDAIVVAYENGYWDIPRDTTLGELADLLGISDNAVSQRLRRGIWTLVDETLLSDR